ncbi:Gfo/Idh/MocA family protein [Amycolatopsis sp. CA-230715]|uniref:Gfo/Idh/MocA family protein n=1 Tax=Amycolatopsis sp. CA-230715 TaxID=2745196 RepID=UPI001C02A838|nr:Gfo/Idh/MocA family oxidoreductase [Amycolatopsis sp. CA-230715]QWF83520.1 Inositol 2-dehydrogenase/D-chiro-inositol 3-dehydrogenase [Amycolatopsis sp. CA-230715]
MRLHKRNETDQEVRIGLVGCGRIAQAAHLPALAKADGVRLAGVYDPSAHLSGEIGRRYGVPVHPALDDLLAADIDAVLIAVPDRAHFEISGAALAAGRHVLVEKPAAATADEAHRLRELVVRSGRKFQVASMKRHDPGLQYAAEAVADGRIGDVYTVSAWYRVMSALRPPTEDALFPAMAIDPEVRQREAEFKRTRRTEHLLRTHAVHTFDLLRYLVGDIEVTSAELAVAGEDHSWHGLGRLRSGAGVAAFEVTASVHGRWTEGFDIYGDRGHLRIAVPFPFTRDVSAVTLFDEPAGTSTRPEFGYRDPYRRQLEAFADAIRDDTDPQPGIDDGVAALELVEAVHKAAA